ncbi:ATP-dependent DNA helicase PcrA [Mycobacteroides abscessus subsp. bolletii]|nr:ATP-dependent DNA helicase PcrA [Mycobacteroides abscessus subsp. bolletii]
MLTIVEGDKFKVFISWSGQLSRRIATIWRDLVKETFDTVEPFMSEENIGAGERGLPKISAELAGTSFGVIVVTQENQNSPWLNYEAGALSKNVGDQTVRVAPTLVDFERKNDVTGPIGQFQASLLNREGVEYVLVEIARLADVDESAVKKRFAHFWREEYECRFNSAKNLSDSPIAAKAKRRSSDDVLDEILTTVRDLARTSAAAEINEQAVAHSGKQKRPVVVLVPGDRVAHDKYGVGDVLEVKGEGESAVALVDFGSGQRVRLMHNFAPVNKL